MTKTSLDNVLNVLSDIVKDVVTQIESSTATTKDHYALYMLLIDKVASMDKGATPEMLVKVKLGIGAACVRAGANKNGVNSALRLMGVI